MRKNSFFVCTLLILPFYLVSFFHAKVTDFCGIRPMDIVVYLALIVLGAVFLFSLFILIIICRRKHEYNKILFSQSLRFSKLRQDNMEDVELLGPHISRALDCNHWIEEMTTGLLQHCVAVLKLCHVLTEKVTQIPLVHQKQQRPAELNEFICKTTAQIVPRFEALLRSMASKEVEIRVLEARVGALSSACWSLVISLSLASPKHKEQLVEIVQEMDFHMLMLQMALNKANELEEEPREELTSVQLTSPSTSQLRNTQHIDQNLQKEHHQHSNGRILNSEDDNLRKEIQLKTRDKENEVMTSLLTDEAPADSAIK